MKVSDVISTILSPTSVPKLQPESTVRVNKKSEQTEKSDHTALRAPIKPADILSSDELHMLNQLFPEWNNGNGETTLYSLKRTKAQITKLGSFIDVKK